MALPRRNRVSRRSITAAAFRLIDEVRYIQGSPAILDARFVRAGPFLLSSTGTGDAWLLDPADGLAARVARAGTREPVDIEETDINVAVTWKGRYSIDGARFTYIHSASGRDVTITGYPTAPLIRPAPVGP